jgi:5'-3' exonuclease
MRWNRLPRSSTSGAGDQKQDTQALFHCRSGLLRSRQTMKVHLVDGTYELFRAYYGPPGAKSPSGHEVGATRAIMRSLLSLLAEKEVTHVGVAFDTVIESFRNQLFPGYKTSAGIEPDLLAQFPLAERATEALGVVVWRMIDFEADDALATAAHRFAADRRVSSVLICSPDKDLYQCVSGSRVTIVDRMRKHVLDEAAVKAKLGLLPAQVPDYLALVGDNADGIPGIPRWGAKSAAQVLSHYLRIEEIPDDATRWKVNVRGAASLAKELSGRRQEALLYRTLATLRTDVPLAETLDDLAWRGANRAATIALAEELGDQKLVDRVSRWRS